VEKYKDILDKAKTAKFEVLTTWFYFQMKKDPFLSQISKEDMDYFVNRNKIIEDLIFQIGVADRGIPLSILLVGPYGSGRTSIIYQIRNIIEAIRKESPDKYPLSGDVTSSDYLFSLPDELDEDLETQPWIRAAGKSRDYLLIDDVKPRQIQTINREFVKTKLKLYVISPLDYNEIIQKLDHTPKTIFLDSLSLKDSVEMLSKRIQLNLEDIDRDITVEKLFENKAISQICNWSMGIPLLILQNCSKALEIVAESEKQIVTEKIAQQACEITKTKQAKENITKISKTKTEVFEAILSQERTPTELSSILQKDRTTISRQLNDLKKLGIVEIQTRGRESLFRPTMAAKIAYEIETMEEIG